MTGLIAPVPAADPAEHRRSRSGVTGSWRLAYDGFDPDVEGTREALLTLGNGYWGTRGSAPGATADGIHYPGTYLAGVYNRLRTDLGGRVVEDEHLVNAPGLDLAHRRPAGQTRVAARFGGDVELCAAARPAPWRTHLRFPLRDAEGRTTLVTSRSFLHLAQVHLAVLQTTVEAEDWSGPLTVRSGIEGRVANRNVAEYQLLAARHLEPVTARQVDPETVLLEVVTSQSRVHIAMAARTRLRAGSEPARRLLDGIRTTLATSSLWS